MELLQKRRRQERLRKQIQRRLKASKFTFAALDSINPLPFRSNNKDVRTRKKPSPICNQHLLKSKQTL